MRQRNKSDKLLVWVPEHGWIYHHTSESTYLEVLKLIGGERLSKVALEISHLPVFTKEPYPQFAKYMKSIGHGWFVNTIGGTSNKYLQLNTINDKLHLNMKVELVPEGVLSHIEAQSLKKQGVKFDLGEKRTRKLDDTLLVDFDGQTFDLKNRNGREIFAKLIESIGAKEVSKLNLKNGSEDFVTSMQVYDNQIPCGVFWVSVPNSTKGKHKIILTIKAMLKLDLTITTLSKEERCERQLEKYKSEMGELMKIMADMNSGEIMLYQK